MGQDSSISHHEGLNVGQLLAAYKRNDHNKTYPVILAFLQWLCIPSIAKPTIALQMPLDFQISGLPRLHTFPAHLSNSDNRDNFCVAVVLGTPFLRSMYPCCWQVCSPTDLGLLCAGECKIQTSRSTTPVMMLHIPRHMQHYSRKCNTNCSRQLQLRCTKPKEHRLLAIRVIQGRLLHRETCNAHASECLTKKARVCSYAFQC